jgi:hypothetical protein
MANLPNIKKNDVNAAPIKVSFRVIVPSGRVLKIIENSNVVLANRITMFNI